jgi:three-Cys-motif partner protein
MPDRSLVEELQLFESDVLQDPDVDDQTLRNIGLPTNSVKAAREFGRWTADKLRVLELYLMVYRRVAGNGSYIDAFAGEGHALIDGEVRAGSPLVAAKSDAFRQLFLCERNRAKVAKLRTAIVELNERQAQRCEDPHRGDANLWIPGLLASGVVPLDRPCFAFLDPNSTQLHWSTVEALATFKRRVPDTRHCKVELLILFNDRQVINRFWESKRRKLDSPPRNAATLDTIFGSRDAWWDLWVEGKPSPHLLHRYVARLQAFGYGHVRAGAILDPKTGQAQYQLVHATDHRAAVSFMRWVRNALAKERDSGEQLQFFAER